MVNFKNDYSLVVEQWLNKKIGIEKALRRVIETVSRNKIEQANFIKKTAERIEELIEDGKKLVKPKLQNKWKEFVFLSCTPLPGSLGITETETVKGCIKLMKALSDDRTCQEAERAIFEEGFGWVLVLHSYLVAMHSIYFHQRGKEYWIYWQEQKRPELNLTDADLV